MTDRSITSSQLTRRIHLLADFLAVAREGGIRQASSAGHLSQSAVTRRIQDLERELGVALFERTARGMSLTAFGKVLKHHAEMIDLTCSYAVGEINDLLSGGVGELRLAAGPAYVYSLVPDALLPLQQRFPKVNVRLLSRLNDVTLPMLAAGELDAVLGGLPEATARAPDIVYEPLLEVQQWVFAGPRHPLHRRTRITPAHLVESPWIRAIESVSGRVMLAEYFRSAGLVPPVSAIETTSLHAAFRLMQGGGYLTLLPSTLAPVAAQAGLQPLRTARPVGQYTSGLMYREPVLRLKAFGAFRQLLAEQVRAAKGR